MAQQKSSAFQGPRISQDTARELLEAAKEAVIHLRELKAAQGALFQADRELEILVTAILKAEPR